jgi:ribosome-associated protein
MTQDIPRATGKSRKPRRAVPKRRRVGKPDPARARATRKFAIDAARLLKDRHGEDILVLDVRGRSPVTDYLVLATGTSDRQVRSVADDVRDLATTVGLPAFGRHGDASAQWVALDFVDVVVHLFAPAARAHYDLEMLWGDAPRIVWRRRVKPGTKSKP